MSYIKKFLTFLSIYDNRGKTVSITNILMWVVIYKVCRTPVLNVGDLVILLGALYNYTNRRKYNSSEEENVK